MRPGLGLPGSWFVGGIPDAAVIGRSLPGADFSQKKIDSGSEGQLTYTRSPTVVMGTLMFHPTFPQSNFRSQRAISRRSAPSGEHADTRSSGVPRFLGGCASNQPRKAGAESQKRMPSAGAFALAQIPAFRKVCVPVAFQGDTVRASDAIVRYRKTQRGPGGSRGNAGLMPNDELGWRAPGDPGNERRGYGGAVSRSGEGPRVCENWVAEPPVFRGV